MHNTYNPNYLCLKYIKLDKQNTKSNNKMGEDYELLCTQSHRDCWRERKMQITENLQICSISLVTEKCRSTRMKTFQVSK